MNPGARSLSALLAGVLIVNPIAPAAQPSRPAAAPLQAAAWVDLARAAGARFGLPADWILAVIRQESGGDARAVSRRGAAGLMQLMPATYAELRRRYGLGEDIFDPGDNILAGAAYLRALYDRYGPDGFLAAYNAGPARYQRALQGEPLPAETLAYLRRLSAEIDALPPARGQRVTTPWPVSPLFVGGSAVLISRPKAPLAVAETRPAVAAGAADGRLFATRWPDLTVPGTRP